MDKVFNKSMTDIGQMQYQIQINRSMKGGIKSEIERKRGENETILSYK